MTGLTFEPAHRLAALIRERRVSAAEVLDAHLAQIARHNPALNAIVTLDEDGARRRAGEADAALARGEVWGPLHGVPVTIKDALETAALRTTAGRPPLLVPAAAVPAFTHRIPGGSIDVDGHKLPYGAAGSHYARIFTFTGNPAVTIPIARSEHGLPTAAQLIGRRWRG
jgi:Asp-tRNA(Asn)/Glu-tRNA(Gln) amidotransferase A subunit family amidase